MLAIEIIPPTRNLRLFYDHYHHWLGTVHFLVSNPQLSGNMLPPYLFGMWGTNFTVGQTVHVAPLSSVTFRLCLVTCLLSGSYISRLQHRDVLVTQSQYLLHQSKCGGVGDSRGGVGHGTHHCHPPCQRCSRARREILLVGGTRLSQVHVHVYQTCVSWEGAC